MKAFSLILASALIFGACKPEERVISVPEPSWQLLAASEAPSALKVIEQPGSKIINEDAYLAANSEAFPAVAKMVEYGARLYLLKKEMPQMEVLDKATFKKLATIDFPHSGNPIDITIPNATTAYVIHAGTAQADVVDIYSNKLAQTINVGRTPIAITSLGYHVYVANQEDNTLSVIDTRTNTAIATVPVHTAPVALQSHTAQNEVLVLSLGSGKLLKESGEKSPARVTFIDNATQQIINSISVYDVAKDSLTAEPLGFTLAQGSYPYAFVAFKTVMMRVDARRHSVTRILRQPANAGIQYNFKREELLLFNTNGNTLQIITADPVSGDKRMTTTLPFIPDAIIPF